MRVSFIIPIFNQLALTQACLGSLKSTLPAGLSHEIILVDDGSSDETRAFLRELAPPYVVLFNPRNLGYAASNNRAAAVAQGEFLALLNNDLVLRPGWLEPMLAAFDQIPNAGVVGNIQLSAESGSVDHAGVIFRDGGYPVHHRESIRTVQNRGAYVEFPGGVTAACCLVKRDWFIRRGGFDPGYQNGFEDTDLCLRAKEDGLINVVATASTVDHHVSPSSGRHAHEYRNAERFLARWGPRTAALEKTWSVAEARRHSADVARAFFKPVMRRLGFGSRNLRRHHRAALSSERAARFAATRPVRIGVDLSRMLPGGANGGIKPFVFSMISEMGRQRPRSFNFAVFAEPALRDELAVLLRPGDFLLERSDEDVKVFCRQPNGWRDAGQFARERASQRAELDVLYAPFGVSEFTRPGLPWISLVVDVLHRDLPGALPIEEVNLREKNFSAVADHANYIQCNSEHVRKQMAGYYGLHPSRTFTLYNAVQNRLPAPSASDPLPPGAPDGPYFFYPSNFWPHKNHETLFVAYRLYLQGAGTRAWPLVLTGAPDARMAVLQEMGAGLKISEHVFFLGHLDDHAFSVVWARAGALVFPSLHEGFGIPLLEAMRFGVPIIAAQTTALPEIGGDACVYFDPADPRGIADVLRRVAIREALREDLVARGRKRLGAFSLELEAGRLAHFLEAAARRQMP